MKYELRKVFLEKYPKYEIILRMYEEANGCECTFESLSKIRLQKFIDYMSGRVAKSSARQYAAKFKAVLNLYSEEFHIPNDYIKILNLRNEKCVSIWLNDGELASRRLMSSNGFQDIRPKVGMNDLYKRSSL